MNVPDLVRASEPIVNSLAEGHICRSLVLWSLLAPNYFLYLL